MYSPFSCDLSVDGSVGMYGEFRDFETVNEN